jgi:hypothetical protein
MTYKELRCINKIDKFPFVCNHYLDDMDLGEGETERYCRRCGIWWNIRQTAEFNLIYRRMAVAPVKEYHRGGVVMEEP